MSAITKARRSSLAATYVHSPAAAAIDALEAAMGGRAPLVAALLQVAPANDAQEEALTYVMGLIADPRHATTKLSTLCARGGITVGELLDAYKNGSLAQMQIEMITAAAKHMPAIVADLFTRAQPHQVTCSRCKGSASVTLEEGDPGWVAPKQDQEPGPQIGPCPRCVGTGTLDVLPELERQKLALEVAQLLPKKGPLIDARSVHVIPGGGGGGFPDFTKIIAASDHVLHPRRRVEEIEDGEAPAEAEVIEAEGLPAEGDAADPTPPEELTPPA